VIADYCLDPNELGYKIITEKTLEILRTVKLKLKDLKFQK